MPSCLELFQNSAETFVENFRSDNSLLVFLHVPKTAGSSVQRDLHREFPNGYRVDWECIDQSWQQFIEIHDLRPFHHARGHIKSEHLDLLDEKNIEYRGISYLRNPIERIVSNFQYCVSPESPRCLINRQKYPDLKSFMDDCIEPNHCTNLLVGPCSTTEEAIQKIGQRYAFIGLREFYHVSQCLLMACLGRSYQMRKPLNVTEVGCDYMASLDSKTRNELLELHRIDLEVFHYFQNQYCRIADQLFAHMLKSQTFQINRPTQFRSAA